MEQYHAWSWVVGSLEDEVMTHTISRWLGCGFLLLEKNLGAKPHVRPHPKNTRKQYHILVIRGMKTLAVRKDFDRCFMGFQVLI